ncbi:MAG: LLM class F420-dependent oxidoreductase [Alphaproteobacteria bacterium]|nr:LLM class F420-dependent oxidoreductase [Alphaproteobacteria bacterium]
MRFGVSFPQTDIGADPGAAGAFAVAAENLGFDHMATYDHVLGANKASRPDWTGAYTSADSFLEPFVHFGYVAALTRTLELSTHVLILPQRQTALVAKQAATVDFLSGGRLRLGVGLGWNAVEYEALGCDFHTRGKRSEEQVLLMKRLWTEPYVTFAGADHRITDAGINPLPRQRPIPVWFGGRAQPVLGRIARVGDGWVVLHAPPNQAMKGEIGTLRRLAREAGRPEGAVGIDAWVSMGEATAEDWRREVAGWAALGATHVTLNTAFPRWHHKRIAGRTTDAHIAAAKAWIAAVKG